MLKTTTLNRHKRQVQMSVWVTGDRMPISATVSQYIAGSLSEDIYRGNWILLGNQQINPLHIVRFTITDLEETP